MTANELRNLVFELLSERLKQEAGDGEQAGYVGLQGDAIVLMQPGGDHLGIRVLPVTIGVPA